MDNNQQKDNRPGGGRMPNGNKVPFMAILAIALVVILGITMFSGMFRSSSSTEISYDKFLDWLDAGYIKSVTIGSSKIDIELKGDELLTLTGQGSVTYYTGNPGDLFLVERLNKAGVTFKEKNDRSILTFPKTGRIVFIHKRQTTDTILLNKFQLLFGTCNSLRAVQGFYDTFINIR